MSLRLNPSSGDVGVNQVITCKIPGYIQNEDDYLWISWDELTVKFMGSNELRFTRPDGRPGQQVKVQVFSFRTPISDVAIYTYHDKGN